MEGPAIYVPMTPAASAITGEEALALFGRACADIPGLAGTARVIGQKKGSINQIFHIESGEKQFALRVRYNESHFQYEKGVFKEVLAALLLSALERDGSGAAGRKLAALWQTLSGRRSCELVHFSCGPSIYYFDFTGSEYAGPWAILEWTGEAIGADFGPAHAFRLGKIVSNVHRIKFKYAFRTLHERRRWRHRYI